MKVTLSRSDKLNRQLYDLVLLWPQIRAETTKEELLAKAQQAKSHLLSAVDRMGVTLAPKSGGGGIGLRSRKKR